MTTDIGWTPHCSFVQGLVRDGEAGMQPESAANPRVISVGIYEPEVLDQTRYRPVVAVAIRDLVAQHC